MGVGSHAVGKSTYGPLLVFSHEVHDVALFTVEFHSPSIGPSHQSVEVIMEFDVVLK